MTANRPATYASGEGVSPGAFATTHWTRVLASQGKSLDAQQALSDLCAAYYSPVVAFLRREGRNEDSARELAHEFFAKILEKNSLGRPDPHRGRFRSYLLGALKHFLANERMRLARQKRGSEFLHEPISDEQVRSKSSDASTASPEMSFDRDWALSILERALNSLRIEWGASGNPNSFEILKPWLTGDPPVETQAETALKLNMTPGALRVAIHRMRQRFRRLVKAEIAHTVESPGDVEEEMRSLIEALS